jgi:ParB family chromosome partitioning protein
MLEEGKLEMGHARSLLTLSEEEQLECAKRVVEESLSVRECEAMVSSLSGGKKTSNKTQTNKDPNTISLERELSEILGSPVEIKHNQKGKGKLIVSFKNLDTLQGVLDKIKS